MTKLDNVQVLRAVAALMVVVSHVGAETVQLAAGRGLSLSFDPTPWTTGVDLFFLISGFIMVVTTQDAFGHPREAGRFLLRRFARIVPLYWLLTTALLLGALLAPRWLTAPVDDLGLIIASYLFFPYPRPAGPMQPVLSLGWTLNYEMLFYLILAAAILLPLRMGLAAAAAILAALALAGPSLAPPGTAIAFWAQPVLVEFIIGGAVGLAFLGGVRLPRRLAWVLLAAGALGLATSAGAAADRGSMAGVLRIALPAGAILMAAACGPAWRGPAATLGVPLGDASYSLYLLHPFLMRPLRMVWTAVPVLPIALYPPLALATAAVCAWVLYRLFEKPVTGLLTARLRTTGR